jgi:anti-sigma regulatory factor (Ser/Thr protein kinase)
MRVAHPPSSADETVEGTEKDCRRFAASLSSVTSARRFVAEALVHVPKPLRESVELMVSELASNCVMHADAGFEVCIVRTAGVVRVEVTDTGSGVPVLKHPDVNDLRGRGLVIVKELADEWGVVRRTGQAGKMVWFAIRGT